MSPYVIYCQKLDFSSYIFVANSMGIASTGLTQLALKSYVFSVVTQNNGHYAAEGHSRSLILVPPKSPYANLHLISHRFQVIADYWSDFRF